MTFPIALPIEPMLAKPVATLPVAPGMSYEPKWDGYRCVIFRDGDQVELASRGGKTLTRYFPEVIEQARQQLPPRIVVDGELVVIRAETGRSRLDFDLLGQRIHPAASRVRLLAEQIPASFVAFDLLALGDEVLLDEPFTTRRARLADALAAVTAPVHLTPVTTEPGTARRWFEIFEGAGLDGVIAKPAELRYEPGKRTMFKVKHGRTADVVVAGFRWHKSGPVVGSLLLGLFDDAGVLHHVGVCASFTAARRAELVDEMAPLRTTAADHPWGSGDDGSGQRIPGAPSRWSGGKNLEWQPLRPELVAEVAYDAMEGDRFRHTARFQRWRTDREPASCRYDQLDRPVRFDVHRVLAGDPTSQQ
ncbi:MULTISPECIES: ATP-dependent DNA ligase [unclassified Solwaraspora]|uniref:ATP-dependent DNA ligase n=1 Tax=unclassified Solwaraspora TaxID=2627926 RepID=UPI00248BD95D|nr:MULTISPECIES: ATP-dependent DNA ligase [unclassified Solwaraspora]WBB98732.1 ATP-dependent DNA ligase [Solwaraspora sp. WMMA2059]WBC22715.1 ATP-dependent DNA ligase [Solwaraspora sp. WMMA2080]WJK35235.1 ATP-dependent DNA ligase [Solwaraspora sp. WMMA2065]